MNLRIIQVTPVVNFSAPNVQAHGHGHSHDEDVVKAQTKHRWSKEANTQIQEDEILEEDIIDLPPQRGPQPKVNHGHSHEGHGHDTAVMTMVRRSMAHCCSRFLSEKCHRFQKIFRS